MAEVRTKQSGAHLSDPCRPGPHQSGPRQSLVRAFCPALGRGLWPTIKQAPGQEFGQELENSNREFQILEVPANG